MNYLDQNKVQAAINSAMPEYIALKEAQCKPGARLDELVAELRPDDDDIIPSDPAKLGEYYDHQGVLTFESALINMCTGEVKQSCVVVDAQHCRSIELQGLRDHQRVLQLTTENGIFRDNTAYLESQLLIERADGQRLVLSRSIWMGLAALLALYPLANVGIWLFGR